MFLLQCVNKDIIIILTGYYPYLMLLKEYTCSNKLNTINIIKYNRIVFIMNSVLKKYILKFFLNVVKVLFSTVSWSINEPYHGQAMYHIMVKQ